MQRDNEFVQKIASSSNKTALSAKNSKSSFADIDQELSNISSSESSICGGTHGSINAITKTYTNSQTSLPATNTANWSTSLQTVLDQPPSNLPQKLLLGGMAFSLAFVTWATVGQVEEVGHAKGQLVPQGKVYKVHPIESGKIVSIAVKEGQSVKAGQVLVELDTEIAASEVERLQRLVPAYQTELSQKQGLINRVRLEAKTREAIAQADLQAHTAAIAATKAKIATTRELITHLQTEAKASKERLAKIKPLTGTYQQRLKQMQADVKVHQARIQRLKPLIESGAISKDRLFEVEQALRDRNSAITRSHLEEGMTTKERLYEAEQGLRDRTSAISQNQGALQQDLAEVKRMQAVLQQKQAEARINQIETQQRIQQLEIEITELKTKITETRNLLNTAQAKLVQKFLHAPIDGVVSFLSIPNVGEVVQPGQTIAELASHSAPLVLSASLPTKEAGFVKVDMPVKVKLDAYPFQDYGIVPGKVVSISPDAKPDEQLGAVYRVEVALNRNYVTANQQQIRFKAGQTATADIVIRHRRIIDIVLEPVKQLQKGGINL